mgnify:CR=1 FL=1
MQVPTHPHPCTRSCIHCSDVAAAISWCHLPHSHDLRDADRPRVGLATPSESAKQLSDSPTGLLERDPSATGHPNVAPLNRVSVEGGKSTRYHGHRQWDFIPPDNCELLPDPSRVSLALQLTPTPLAHQLDTQSACFLAQGKPHVSHEEPQGAGLVFPNVTIQSLQGIL